MFSKKIEIYYPIWLHIILLSFLIPVLNMLVFNFHKMMDMPKAYAY